MLAAQALIEVLLTSRVDRRRGDDPPAGATTTPEAS